MQLGMIGLGRMGGNMVRRLMRGGHQCVVFDADASAIAAMRAEGAAGVSSLDELVSSLGAPRVVWVMVPAGEPTEETITAVGERLQAGDTVVDGGNSFYKDDVRRAAQLSLRGIHYVDAGTSGGIWGRQRGYCLTLGGPTEAFQHIEPLLRTLAPGEGDVAATPGRGGPEDTATQGYLHCGPAGAGHFVKMVHNGIEYGMMQALAEGFDLLRGSASNQLPPQWRYDFHLADIAEVWRRGSVIGSWLLDLTASALTEDPELAGYTGSVQDSGEGRWTVGAAVEAGVPIGVLAAALFARFRSRTENTFGEKVLSAMREKFGGHAVQSADR